jgi:serine/threonine protein kinase
MLRDRFMVCRCLHRGPNSTVVAAMQRSSRLKCAVKIVPKRTLCDRDAQLAVAREVSLLARLDHPHLVRFVDAFETREAVFIATEFCTCDLFWYLSQSAAGLSEREALQLIRQLLVVVDFLHGHRVAHRDIKLENIMLVGVRGTSPSPSSDGESDEHDHEYCVHQTDDGHEEDEEEDEDDDDDDDDEDDDDDDGVDHHLHGGGAHGDYGRPAYEQGSERNHGRREGLPHFEGRHCDDHSVMPRGLSLGSRGATTRRRSCPTLKLTDFGLSYWRAPDATGVTTRQRSGTPFYAAPEVLEVSDLGYVPEFADLWSCGVVLFALLTRRLPFQGRTFGALRRGMEPDAVGGLVRGVRGCSDATRRALLALLAADPDARPSARDAVGMVDEALRHAACARPPQWRKDQSLR